VNAATPIARQRVAVVGAGWFAQAHLAGWRDAGAEVVALCDLDRVRADAVAAQHGIARTFEVPEQMLDAMQPSLVDVVLPPAAQAAVVRAALERRLPTICQKPFGRDLADAHELADFAAQQQTPLVVHENFRFMPWFRECKRLIGAGHFGRVHGISFRLRPGDGQGAQAYLDRQPTFRSMPRLLVRETAVHFIDTFRWLLGDVRAVTARLRRLNPAIAGEDAAQLLLEFDDDRTGLFDGNRLNGCAAAEARRTMGELWLEGERGVLRLDGDARLWWLAHGAAAETEHHYPMHHPFAQPGAAFGGAVAALQAHVLAHLERGTPLENTAHDYLPNLHVQAAAYHSHASGTRVLMAAFDPPRHDD
jgi:D-apiose dehydrogenase